jgi:DNA-binding transcriptional ArsR family regulator
VKYNPYRPGKAVTPGLFAGRARQLAELNRALRQTKQGNAHHLVAFGERGIGKSSLLDAAAAAASGEAVDNLDAYNFVVIQIGLTDKDDDLSIVKKITARLQHELSKRRKIQELLKSSWGLVERIEVAGTGLRQKGSADGTIIDPAGDLARILAEAVRALEDRADGILILVDEADPAGASLGRVSKQLVDSLADEGCEHVCLVVAGMPGVISRLREGHESAPRIFEPIHLERMADDESKEIVRKGLAEVAAKTGVVVTIDDGALEAVAHFSDGYPQFVQQIASSSYELDGDNNITIDDVVDGMFDKGGAIEALGTKHFQVPYLELIKSDEYRAVLLAMAQSEALGEGYVSKGYIRSATKLSEITLSNALHKLKETGMIEAHPAKRGEYKLPSLAFAIYVRLASRGREHLREMANES